MDKILKSKLKPELLPNIDVEIIELISAMNAIPGIETTESCCGHGKIPVAVYFKTRRSDGLFFLMRCADRRYFKYSWGVNLVVGDVYRDGEYPVMYVLTNKSTGEYAYKEIQALIDNMNLHLNHKVFMDDFRLNIEDFVTVDKKKENNV